MNRATALRPGALLLALALAGCATGPDMQAPVVDLSATIPQPTVAPVAPQAAPTADAPASVLPDGVTTSPLRSAPRILLPAPARYKVRRGETLFRISHRYGLDYRQVAAWNGIAAPYGVRSGQVLVLHAPTAPATPRPHATITPAPASADQAAAVPAHIPEGVAVHGGVAWKWPTAGHVAGSYNGRGIEIAGHAGQPVYAAAAGHVVYAGSGIRGFGQLIIIKHAHDFLSAYAYNQRLLVREGQTVAQGQQIAEMGRSNKGQAGLHFEIRRQGKPVDPLQYLPGDTVSSAASP